MRPSSADPQLLELKGGDKFTGNVDNCTLTTKIENRMAFYPARYRRHRHHHSSTWLAAA